MRTDPLSDLFVSLAIAPLLLADAAMARPPAWLGLAATAALLGAVLTAGRAAARRALPANAPAASRLTAAVVFASLLLVLPATLLGHLGHLHPQLFLAIEALLTLGLTTAFTLRFEAPDPPPLRHPDGGEASSVLAAEAPHSAPSAVPTWQRAVLGAGFAAALAALVFAVYAERYEPAERLDDPSYHLVTVATWVQHGDLRMPKFHYGDRATSFYPIAGELLDWSLLTPMRDSDFLVRWAQLPFLAALLAAVAAVALRLGATPATTALALLLLLTVRRLFPDLSMSAANDVMAAFFFTAAADALLALGSAESGPGAAAGRRGRGGTGVYLGVYLGASLGLLVGTKYVGVLFAMPLVVGLLLLPALVRHTGGGGTAGLRRWRSHLGTLCVALAVMALTGGYTYLRNLWSLGNPLFPLPLRLGPWGLPGWAASTLDFRRRLPEFAIDPWAFLLHGTWYTGKPFRVTLLPAAVAAPVLRLLWRDRPAESVRSAGIGGRRWLDAVVLALPATLFVLFLVRIYDHRDVRYLFAAFALAAAAFAWLVDRVASTLPRAGRTLHGSVLAGGALLAFLYLFPGDDLELFQRGLLALGVAATGALLGGSGGRMTRAVGSLRPRPRAVLTAAAVAGLVLAAGIAAAPVAGRYTARKYADDAVVRTLQHEAPDGTVVSVVGGNRWYRLFGARLQNEVRVVPRTGPLEDAFYTWGGNATFPFDAGDYPAWRRNLAQAGARYVVVHRGEEDSPVRDWMEELRRDFQRIAVADGRELWRRGRPTPWQGPGSPDSRTAPGPSSTDQP